MADKAAISRAGVLIGFGLIALAAVVFVNAWTMQVPPTYARVGPHIFPIAISLGLALVGLYFVWNAAAPGRGREVVAEDAETDWLAVAVIAAGLVAHLNILRPLGFIPAAVLLFMCVSFAFGSRRYGRDGLIAVILAAVAYAGFRYGLGLQLPPGLLRYVI